LSPEATRGVPSALKKGDEIALKIESLAYGGQGVSHFHGLTIFVERSLPGQTVLARIYKKKKSFAEAYPLQVIEKAPNEIDAPCPHFGICGGCRIQNLAYEDQLSIKSQQVDDLLQRIGGFEGVEIPLAMASPDAFHYRNKMEFTFTGRPWRVNLEDHQTEFGLGLHVPGRFDKIVNIQTCLLQNDDMNAILKFTGQWAEENDWEPYDLKDHVGWARNLILRRGTHTGDLMVNLVTSTYEESLVKPYAAAITEQFQSVTTIVNNVTTRRAGVSVGEQEFVLYGPGFIQDKLGEHTFDIASNAFFQTNTRQAERLYAEALEKAELKGDEIVYDLYCGTGTISLFLAEKAKEVYGFELISEAVTNARENAKRLGIENAKFILGDLADLFHPEKERPDIPSADVIVVDPPRAGLHPRVVKEIIRVAPERVVYVSCNPSTLARDLQLLCEEHYDLVGVQPVDMFPHTTHIESVVALKLKSKAPEGEDVL
jgi:23S rRNA (uracil1939-C5)-methyltransferase